MRICRNCKCELPLEAFQIERRVKDGRRSVCKMCFRLLRRGQHTGGQHRSKTIEKDRARGRLRDAVRYNKVIKPDHCQRCRQRTDRRLLDGHHHDYSKPLDVVWLCRPCHGLEAMTWKAA